jgi:integrase
VGQETWLQGADNLRKHIYSKINIQPQHSLDNPENVKEYIANANLSEARKQKISYDYLRYCKFRNISWNPPKYKPTEAMPFIPLESEVDQLISGMGRRMSAFLQLLKETGIRPGEGWQIKWSDLDTERKTITVQAEKHSYSRTLKLSDRAIAMLNLQKRQGKYIFHQDNVNPILSLIYARRVFERRRKRLTSKLANPRISQINFRTLRHFKATMLYTRTKDLLLVKQILGHKSLSSTIRYTHLVTFESDEYVCKAVQSVKEATSLIEDGFEYVTDMDGVKLFRKRK